jgi:hypothetical protein
METKKKKLDVYSLRLGKKKEEIYRRETGRHAIEARVKRKGSRYDLLDLGHGTASGAGKFRITQEDLRYHMQVIGGTGKGKSRFLYLLMQYLIDRGQGFCFLDPTGGAKTLQSVLEYCWSVGHEKVCLIDPYDYIRFRKVPIINPLLSFKDKPWLHKYAVTNVRSAARVLTGQKDPGDTMIINKYLKSLLYMLVDAEMTLYDAVYFTEYDTHRLEREYIFDNCSPNSRHVEAVTSAFKNLTTFNTLIGSSARRLDDVFDPPLKWIFGSNEGTTEKHKRKWEFIDFEKMVSQGWIILVNLDTEGGADPLEMRFLGTIIINEIVSAIHRLIKGSPWRGQYHLIIDEAEDYANRKLSDLLDKKRNLGLSVVFAHHTFGQFEDEKVLQSIINNAHFKVAFNPGSEGAFRTARMLYGGELEDRHVAYQLKHLRKQHAVIKVDIQDPHIVRIEDVPDMEGVTEEDIEDYKFQIYEQPWYKSPAQVEKEIKERINVSRTIRKNPESPKPRKAPDRKADSKASVPTGIQKRQQQQSLPARNEKPKEAGKPNTTPIKI